MAKKGGECLERNEVQSKDSFTFRSGHSLMNGWFVYILHCNDHSFYVGISQNVELRVQRHNDGFGAEYTKTRRPVVLLWKEFAESEKEARKRERQIKGWSRIKKENLILNRHPNSSDI